MSAKLIYKPSQKIKNVCSRTNRFDNLYGIIHYKKMQIKIYKFVCKDNRRNPYVLTFSDTLLRDSTGLHTNNEISKRHPNKSTLPY